MPSTFILNFFFRKTFHLHSEPIESNDLLVESDRSTVPWIPLTPTLLLPYHIDFERIPLTFCPRNKRMVKYFIHRIFILSVEGCYDIDIIIPANRKRRTTVQHEEKKNQDKKKRKKTKKKNAQRRKKKSTEQSNK
jgi:hypothetical protein